MESKKVFKGLKPDNATLALLSDFRAVVIQTVLSCMSQTILDLMEGKNEAHAAACLMTFANNNFECRCALEAKNPYWGIEFKNTSQLVFEKRKDATIEDIKDVLIEFLDARNACAKPAKKQAEALDAEGALKRLQKQIDAIAKRTDDTLCVAFLRGLDVESLWSTYQDKAKAK